MLGYYDEPFKLVSCHFSFNWCNISQPSDLTITPTRPDTFQPWK